MTSQAADITGVQADSDPPHAERAAAAEAAAQQLLAEEEREAAKAAAKKSKKQKQKVKKQLRQQQQQQEPSTPEDAGSPTTSDHEQYSDGLAAAVTAGDGTSAEAGSISPATPDASSQAPSGSDRQTHHPHTLVSDPQALFSVTDRPLHDLSTADSHGAAGLHPRQGASGLADASHAEGAATVTSSCEHLDMADTGQIARLLSCPITKVGPIAVRTSTCKLLGPSHTVCCCLLHSAAVQPSMMCWYSCLPCCAVLCGAVMSDLLLQKLMVEPVIAADGHTYERSAMKHWLQQNDTSPVTHLPLPHKRLVSNVVIRSAILNHPQQLQWH